jgi:hypothetical protein
MLRHVSKSVFLFVRELYAEDDAIEHGAELVDGTPVQKSTLKGCLEVECAATAPQSARRQRDRQSKHQRTSTPTSNSNATMRPLARTHGTRGPVTADALVSMSIMLCWRHGAPPREDDRAMLGGLDDVGDDAVIGLQADG